MSTRGSAGLLMYRARHGRLEVLLVHPGGPYFRNKDEGSWSIPKGEIARDEDPLAAARRELTEETGLEAQGPFLWLGRVRQPGGKTVEGWAVEGDCDPAAIVSNTFAMEWPPRSGRQASFPEIDRAAFFDLEEAGRKIHPAQRALLDRLPQRLGREGTDAAGVPLTPSQHAARGEDPPTPKRRG